MQASILITTATLCCSLLSLGCDNSAAKRKPDGDHTEAEQRAAAEEKTAAEITADYRRFAKEWGYNPGAHHEVLRYFRKLWAGKPRNAAFEAKSLNRDLRFRMLNWAELIVAMCAEIDLPISEAVEFASIGKGPNPLPEGLLLRKVAALAKTHSEEERARRILTDPETTKIASLPIANPLDRVESLMRYCVAIEAWCRKGKPSRFPSLSVTDRRVPPHMRTYHPDEIRHYHERRKALGKPWEEKPTTAIPKYIAYELKRWKKRELAVEKIALSTNLRSVLGFDNLDVVELLSGLKDHYDARIRFADEFDPKTVGDIIDEVNRQLRLGK